MAMIRLSEDDNVGVATSSIAAGDRLGVDALEVVARDPIPFAHKIALRPIAAGEKVIKFGVPIGSATVPIEAGDHVHVHNIKSDYINNEVDYFEAAGSDSAEGTDR
jgi:altronate dehydratase